MKDEYNNGLICGLTEEGIHVIVPYVDRYDVTGLLLCLLYLSKFHVY